MLISQRLIIRPFQIDDARIVNKTIAGSFKQLHQWMEWAKEPQTMKQTKEFIQHAQTCWSSKVGTHLTPRELPFVIFDAEGEVIGSIGLNAICWDIPSFEIGYWASVHFQGQGLITEAVNIVTRYACTTWHAKRIEIRCDSENKKSAAVAMRLGFELEAHFKNHRIQSSNKISGTYVFARYTLKGLPKISYRVEYI
jgi:RimJ/RimL family protein N-acetyltransferase